MPARPDASAAPPPKRQKTPRVLSETTIRAPAFHHLHLMLLSSATAGIDASSEASADVLAVDELTARACLTAALKQFLGETGSAIPVDILRCTGRDVWVRVPHDDAAAAIEALSGWVGSDVAWRIVASGAWLGGLAAGNGRELFRD